MKIGRNQVCPKCNSGKKYKKCCGDPKRQDHLINQSTTLSSTTTRDIIEACHKQNSVKEHIRRQQQGFGKPIIEAKSKGNQFVAVGNTLYYSPKWKTFPDFLLDYIKMILDESWGNKELQKPAKEQHPIIQWYTQLCIHQAKYIKNAGEPTPITANGLTHCYLGLAYSLYLIKHNVELQKILIERLKDINNFQGAYYELIVANCLIRAGFELELEDEQDERKKHCEFSAISKATGKKYWVEAKSRSVVGVLGKNESNGTTRSDPTCKLSDHIKNAFLKPAQDERLIFVDVNTKCASNNTPDWFDRAENKLKMKERDLSPDQTAYVFVTNLPFHLHLDSEHHTVAILPYGLGIPDFVKNEPLRLSEIYKRKQKHIDAFNIMDSFAQYMKFPETFDGSLPSDTFLKNSQKIQIGERYFFEDICADGTLATVTTATVDETNKCIMIGTDSGHILTKPMTDEEFRDYQNHPDAYFGSIYRQGRKSNDIYEFFENIVEIHMGYSKESTLKHMEKWSNYEDIQKLSKEEIVLLYCESIAHHMHKSSKRI
jgi:hypothetical protein